MTRRFALSVAVVVAQATCLLLAPTATWADDRCVSGPAPKSSPALAGACAVLAAVNARDIATLARLMADDFALTAVTGNYFPDSKAQMIARWTAEAAPGTTSHSTLTKVLRTFQRGDFGFVAGEIEDRTIGRGTAECSAHTFTDIWVRRDGRWVWLQSHESGVRTTPCGS